MSELKDRREALEQKIADLEGTLAGLRTQLKAETEREQHEAIDRLEEFIGAVDSKHASLQDFWKVLREEVRELFGTASDTTEKKT